MALTTFTAAQVLTAAQLNAVQANDYNQTVSTKTASYTLVAADKGTRVVMNVASANTVTVNTSLFSAGDTLIIQNIGAGVTTVTAGTATVSSAGPLAIPQYGSGTLYFTSAGVAVFFPSAGAAAASNLKFISSTQLSGASVTVSNAFSASYDSYYITMLNINAASTVNVRFRLGAGVNHTFNLDYQTPGSALSNFTSGTNQTAFISNTLDAVTNVIIRVGSPFLVAPTIFDAYSSNNNQFFVCKGNETSSTSFTDFTVNPIAANWSSGEVKVFGYTNS